MMVGRILLISALAFPLSLQAQKKEILELQRDMALLQDKVRVSDEKIDALTTLVQQVLERVNATNGEVTALKTDLGNTIQAQQKQVSAPIASMSADFRSMMTEFQQVRESVAEVNIKLGRLQTQVTDLRTAVTLASAPAAPPGQGDLPPAASAQQLFNDAKRDQLAGKTDSALTQYQAFLEAFPTTDLAPEAQYHIGEIYYDRGDFQKAVEAFDDVLERYPDNPMTPDAYYMKGLSLAKGGSNRSAAIELKQLINKFPNHELARKAADELKKMGF